VEPVPPADEATVPERPHWLLTFGFGMSGGSELFRAETVDGFPGYWPGSPFQSARVSTGLDPGPTVGFGLGRRLGSWVSVRGDLSWSRLDATAEAKAGQVGGLFTYDRISIFELALGVETRLAAGPSAPFLGLGLIWRSLAPAREEDLGQSALGPRLALGYEHVMGPGWALRFEGRVSRAPFSTDGYVPSQPPKPVFVDGEDSLTIWQLVLGVQMDL
jgi:hypothetical protein